MKPTIAPTTLAIAFSIALLAGLAPAAHAATCSMATVAGDWAFTLNGVLILPTGPVPIAGIIRGTADINGNVVGTEARNVGGGYGDETLTGNWTINADCTGTASVSAYKAGQLVRTGVLSIVFDKNAKQVRMVQQSLTLPDGTQVPVVATVEGTKQ
jgi:hypothetical protein